MNDFVREFFEDRPELLRRYERNEARYILQLPKNYDKLSCDRGLTAWRSTGLNFAYPFITTL